MGKLIFSASMKSSQFYRITHSCAHQGVKALKFEHAALSLAVDYKR